jgi:hypothetical protein
VRRTVGTGLRAPEGDPVPDDVQSPGARGQPPLEPFQLGRVLLGERAQLTGDVLVRRQDRLFGGRRGWSEAREDGGGRRAGD